MSTATLTANRYLPSVVIARATFRILCSTSITTRGPIEITNQLSKQFSQLAFGCPQFLVLHSTWRTSLTRQDPFKARAGRALGTTSQNYHSLHTWCDNRVRIHTLQPDPAVRELKTCPNTVSREFASPVSHALHSTHPKHAHGNDWWRNYGDCRQKGVCPLSLEGSQSVGLRPLNGVLVAAPHERAMRGNEQPVSRGWACTGQSDSWVFV